MSAQRAAPGMHTDQRRPRTFPLPLRNPQPGYFPLHPRHHGCVRNSLGLHRRIIMLGARHTDTAVRQEHHAGHTHNFLEILEFFHHPPVIDACIGAECGGGGEKDVHIGLPVYQALRTGGAQPAPHAYGIIRHTRLRIPGLDVQLLDAPLRNGAYTF